MDSRFAELWTDFLEGELDEAQLAELRALLAADDQLLARATDLYQTHRLLGLAAKDRSASSDAFAESTMASLPADSRQFTDSVMQHLAPRRRRFSRLHAAAAVVIAAAVLLMAAVRWQMKTVAETPQVVEEPTVAEPVYEVRLAGAARAKFLGEFAPRVGSVLEPQREYVVLEGLLELAFPTGAVVIVESPAVFRITSTESLALDTGHCSVFAPDGAEGFRVETPLTQVVDRGTRFSVNVAETSETEVQVIEGMADVYRRPSVKDESVPAEDASPDARLIRNEALRVTTLEGVAMAATKFSPQTYRSRLPDRIIRYDAELGPDGRAKSLQSVTVQRGGEIITYPFDDLIPVEMLWFKSADSVNPAGHLASADPLPENLGELLSDRSLVSGVINPGGSRIPLTSDPVFAWPESPENPNTPGLAVRFREPVVNGPGPDVVFFELQTLTNPLDGDAFHVSPLEFNPGRRSLTVRSYDLTLTSPEALRLEGFSLYRYSQPIASPEELVTARHVGASTGTRFHGLAVGIDLSDLGFDEGERVEGLFFQDAADDDHMVDPVFIGGFPAR